MKTRDKNTVSATSSLRIIAGQWRGRKLPILTSDGLRPTGDRLRETLFNWLAPYIPRARCLDLFAGTGALGLEALSRGAESATLLELDRVVASQLRRNCATLDATHADVIETSALDWLSQQNGVADAEPRTFDLVFVDPPFAADLWQAAIDALAQHPILAPDAVIYIETPKQVQLQVPEDWLLHRRKQVGAVCCYLFLRQSE